MQLDDTLVEILLIPDPLSGPLHGDLHVQYRASYPVPEIWVPVPTRRLAIRPIPTTRLFQPSDEPRPYDTEQFRRADPDDYPYEGDHR